MSSGYVDRSTVIVEAYPGATNDIQRMIDAAGGLVCELHPHLPFPHDDCAGPGMLRADVSPQLPEEAT